MATLEQIAEALRKADAAGNVEDARALANAYRQMKAQQTPQESERPSWAWKGSAPGAAYDLANWGSDAQGYEPSAVPFLDPINAFANQAVDAIPVVGPTLTGWGNQVDAAFNNMLGFPEQTPEDRAVVNAGDAERYPQMALAGQVAGTTVPLALAAGTPIGGSLLGTTGSVGQQMLMGGLSGAALGSADTLARGGSAADAALWGAAGGVLGAGAPAVGAAVAPWVRTMFGQPNASGGARILSDAVKRDQNSADDISRMLAQDPNFVIADTGPNVQGQAAALATRPSDAQRIVVDALSNRQNPKVANARIRAATDDILGTAVSPMQLGDQLAANRRALSPMYEEVLTDAAPADVSGVVQAISDQSASEAFGGVAQRALTRVENMLTEGGEGIVSDPRALLNVRHEIDAMLYPPGLGAEADPNIKRVLGPIRARIDEELARVAPGIKDVDAQFSELSKQNEAYRTGQQILDSGRDSPRPDEVARLMEGGTTPAAGIGPSAVPLRLSQGARDEIDRIIGTKANDRVALNQVLKGEGSWNYDRLVSAFGKEKTDDLLAVLSRERLMATTENMALSGSRTAPVQAAEKELFDARSRGPIQEALNMRLGDAAAGIADNLLGGVTQAQKQRAYQELAQLLMSGQSSPQAMNDVALALSQHYQGILPPASAGLLLSPNATPPLSITLDGMGQDDPYYVNR